MGNNNNSEHHQQSSWGMGFFLVFFPTDQQQQNPQKTILSSSTCASPLLRSIVKRRTSAQFLTRKAQSTVSICALLLFLSLLLFTLSTLPPTPPPRRHLKLYTTPLSPFYNKPRALQGMGTLYTRGTSAMNDFIICHVTESVNVREFESFIRLLYRSPLYSASDIVFLFSTYSSSSNVLFDSAVYRESQLFLQIIGRVNGSDDSVGASFDVSPFLKSGTMDKESEEPIWGRRARGNFSLGNGTESTRLRYGSVVGFEVEELDPENSLGGFLEHAPMNLRRWACYPMLLGRLRRNFKHVILVDVKDVLLLGDPLGRVETRSPESVYLSTTSTGSTKHGRRNSDKTQSHHAKPVYPSFISGGVRGVRRLSNAMLMEIARAAMQHKRKSSVTESSILSQLVGNGVVLKNVKLVVLNESIPELSSLNSGGALFLSNYTVLRRGNSNLEFYAAFMKHICSFSLDSSVYSDCK